MKLNSIKQMKKFQPNRVYSLPIIVNSRNGTLKLPKSMVDYLKLGGDKTVYCAVINDSLQISANQPNFFIPAMKLDMESFTPQEN